jgi:hypothetical protein
VPSSRVLLSSRGVEPTPKGNLVSIIPTLGSLSIADDPFCGAVNAWRRRSGSELHPIFRRQWAMAVVDEVNCSQHHPCYHTYSHVLVAWVQVHFHRSPTSEW